MTFAMSKELQFLAGHRFHVKLTPMAFRPTSQEVVEYFYSGVPKRMFFWGIWQQFSEILGSV